MRLCVVAGSGDLPKEILKASKNKFENSCVIALKGNAKIEDYSDYVSVELAVGQIGKGLDFLKQNNITHIVFAGAVKRPNLSSIIPDRKGAIVLAKILKSKFLGDDNLLKIVLNYFEESGYTILSTNEFLDLNDEQEGFLTKTKCDKKSFVDIEVGIEIFKQFGLLDIGQSLIISDSRVISVEGAEGTDELIKRSGKYLGNHSVLVKMTKINQDKRVDLPTIGKNTIEGLSAAKINGIIIDKNVIIVSKSETIKLADSKNIYIYLTKKV